MLNKKELNLISNKQPSPAVCRILEDKKICIDCSIEKQFFKKYLVMWIYQSAAPSPSLLWKVVFRKTKSNFEWLAQNLDNMKWYESSLSYLFYYEEDGYKDYLFSSYLGYDCTPSHRFGVLNSRFLLSYFDIEDENCNYIKKIYNMQEKVRNEICKTKAHQKQHGIDSIMAKVPPLPKNFSKWINDTVLYESRYGIYTPSSRKYKPCVCSHCNTEFLIDKGIKINMTGICPYCKSNLIFKSSGRVNIQEEAFCTLIQKLKGTKQLVIRHFTVWKAYKKDNFLNVAPSYHEVARDIYNVESKKFEQYQIRYGAKHFEYISIWRKGRLSGSWWSKPLIGTGRNYTQNLTAVVKGTAFQYSGIQQFPALYEYDVDIFFENYLKEPWREYLVKNKLYNLAAYKHANVNFDFLKKTLNEKLKVSSTYFEKCVEYDVLYYGLEFFQILSLNSIPFNHPLIALCSSIDESMPLYKIGQSRNCEMLCKLLMFCSKNNTSGVSCMNYLNDNYTASKYSYLSSYISDYLDYLKNVLLVEKIVSDRRLKPKNFKKAHDNFADLAVLVNNKKYDIGIQKQYTLLSHVFEKEYKSLCFKLPKSLSDFIAEGKALNHCVATASYGKNHALGKSFIVFVRDIKNKDKPLYTLEISDNGTIYQCRKHGNLCCPEKDMKIIKSYVENMIKNKLNEKSKKTPHPVSIVT